MTPTQLTGDPDADLEAFKRMLVETQRELAPDPEDEEDEEDDPDRTN